MSGAHDRPESSDGTRKLTLRLNSWVCWPLPMSLETEFIEMGEAGDLKGLKGSTSSPALQDRGFSFSPHGTGYILELAAPPRRL